MHKRALITDITSLDDTGYGVHGIERRPSSFNARRFDSSTPDGAPRKLIDISRLGALGWVPHTELTRRICATRAWFLEHRPVLRA